MPQYKHSSHFGSGMKQPAYFGLSLAIAFNSVLLVWGSPSVSIGGFKFGSDTSFENECESVSSNIYNVISSLDEKKGKCMQHIRVTGNGIGDTFDTPCSGDGFVSSVSKNVLIYGSPKDNSFFLFSTEPSILFVYHDGKCTKRTYSTENKKTSKDTRELGEDFCTLIKNNIMFIESLESKYLDALDKHYDEAALAKAANLAKNTKDAKSYKSGSEGYQTRDSSSRPSEPAKATGAAQVLPKSPLGQYAQFQQASKTQPSNLEPVLETHQSIPHNGITVTEQAAPSTNTDSSLAPRSINNEEPTEGNKDTSSPSTSHHSYLSYIGEKYHQLKSELMHHKASHQNS